MGLSKLIDQIEKIVDAVIGGESVSRLPFDQAINLIEQQNQLLFQQIDELRESIAKQSQHDEQMRTELQEQISGQRRDLELLTLAVQERRQFDQGISRDLKKFFDESQKQIDAIAISISELNEETARLYGIVKTRIKGGEEYKKQVEGRFADIEMAIKNLQPPFSISPWDIEPGHEAINLEG